MFTTRSRPHRRAIATASLALAACLAGFSGQSIAQTVQNGGFGSTGSTVTLNGSNSPANWTYVVGNGTGCLIAGDSFTGCGFSTTNPGNSPMGGNFIAIQAESTSAAGTIEQTLTGFVAGNRYTLNFDTAEEGTGPVTWTVSLGGTTLTTVTTSTAGWMADSISFTATSGEASSGLLAFAASTTSGAPPIAFLDAVSIPEPASLLVLGVGAVGMAGARRREVRSAA